MYQYLDKKLKPNKTESPTQMKQKSKSFSRLPFGEHNVQYSSNEPTYNFNMGLSGTRKNIGSSCVVQRYPSALSKATGAVIHAKKHISAGNQRGAVISSEGASMVNLFLLRRHVGVIIDELRDILRRSLNPMIRRIAESDTYHDQIRPFVSAQLAELLKSGNCGEFADVVYKYLVETSGNHLQAYSCSFNTEDHAFNLVYSSEDADSPLFANTIEMGGHEHNIMVADAWGGVKTTLAAFLNGANPYNRPFTLAEIDINDSGKGINRPVFSPEAIATIKAAATRIRSQFSATEATELATDAIRGRHMDGVYGFVEADKPKTYTSDYIIGQLINKIANRSYLLHSISLIQRKEVFRTMRQHGLNDLYNKCMEMYSPNERYDILH